MPIPEIRQTPYQVYARNKWDFSSPSDLLGSWRFLLWSVLRDSIQLSAIPIATVPENYKKHKWIPSNILVMTLHEVLQNQGTLSKKLHLWMLFSKKLHIWIFSFWWFSVKVAPLMLFNKKMQLGMLFSKELHLWMVFSKKKNCTFVCLWCIFWKSANFTTQWLTSSIIYILNTNE